MLTRPICLAAFLLGPIVHAGDDLAPLRTALEQQAKHRTVSVAIRQTKRIPALTEEIVERGQLWLEPGKAFRWQLGTPPAQTAVFDGTKVYLLDETAKTGIELAPDDRRAKPLLLMLGFGEAASLDRMRESFTVKATNHIGEQFAVSLVPKGRLKRVLESMHMQINTRTSFIERIEWTQRDGTVVVTEFFPPTLNQPLPFGSFRIDREAYRWE
ncbi:MAG: LolA family protein [Luteolibacter sp.]